MAVRVEVPPATSDRVEELSVTPVTATVAAVTVTVQVEVYPPSAVVAVMVAVPAATAVTTPPDTVATAELLVDHVTV